MTLPSDNNAPFAKHLSMTEEEKERTLDNLSAVIHSAHPPAWAGVPVPKKRSWWKRAWSHIASFFS